MSLVKSLSAVGVAIETLCASTSASATQDTLLVWASDAKHKAADFLAVVDFDVGSTTYGKVLKVVPLPFSLPTAIPLSTGAIGNEPHHVGISADGKTLAGGGLLSILRVQNHRRSTRGNRPFWLDLQATLDALGTETVYVIEPETKRVRELASRPLGRPTSVQAMQNGVVAASFATSELYHLDGQGKQGTKSILPAGGLAGIAQVGDWLYVTSWQASAIFSGKLGGNFELALGDLKSPSDLGLDSKRQRLLVPNFTEDKVEIVELQ
jgi:hypothetical protein